MSITEAERLQRGKEVCAAWYGAVLPAPAADTGGDPYTEGTLKSLFADVIGRQVLKDRDKRFIILGMLAGLGADPALFEIHARAAVQSGDVSADDLYEFILLSVHYAGQPKTTVLKRVVDKIRADATPGA